LEKYYYVMKKKIFCTVTNDLSYDQRMIRICNSLAAAGYEVTLLGRETPESVPLEQQVFGQRRMKLLFRRGKLFYLEYNIRLFLFLLLRKMDGICAVDLDTILPCYFISRIKRIPRIYDAHELFCEMHEVVRRPFVYKIWKRLEKYSVPRFPHGYTVNGLIAEEFRKMYGVNYETIRNLPLLEDFTPVTAKERIILYQGAVNEGRCFESLIPAMQYVDARLVICGDGNYMSRARDLASRYGLEDKILFKGNVRPGDLKEISRSACCGVTLFDPTGMSNYYSLANRFFDYIHAGIPQLAMNYPAYREINNLLAIAVLIDRPDIQVIAEALNGLLDNTVLYHRLSENCKQARLLYNWQEEEKKLIRFYNQLFY
jgi:glycosyltransferase involved in cell wall biosynthesis